MSFTSTIKGAGLSFDDNSYRISIRDKTDEEYADAAGRLQKSYGLTESLRATKVRLMEMVVSSGKRFMLVTGFKSGFALWPNDRANAKGLIDALLRYVETENSETGTDAVSGGVTLRDIQGLTPHEKDRILMLLLRETLSMNLALRQSLERSLFFSCNLNQLQKVYFQKLQQNEQWAFGEAILEAKEQSQKHGHYPKH